MSTFKDLRAHARALDDTIVELMGRIGMPFLRIGIGVIFIWFGVLKPLGLSPAAELLANTVYWWTPEIVVPAIGWWEVAIGITFLIPQLTRVAIFLLAVQMPGTFLPLVLIAGGLLHRHPVGISPSRANTSSRTSSSLAQHSSLVPPSKPNAV